jgi:hypothetical protein
MVPFSHPSNCILHNALPLIHFSIPEEKISAYPVTDITPKYKECTVEVSVIGVRNILPYRLLPVTKAYVEVDCGGDVIMKTKISEGNSPNFLEVLPLQVKLPASRVFAPPLNIRVFDDRLLYKVFPGSFLFVTFRHWSLHVLFH